MTEPAKTNNRTGVPSTGAEDIGRGSAAIMVARRRFPGAALNNTSESLWIGWSHQLPRANCFNPALQSERIRIAAASRGMAHRSPVDGIAALAECPLLKRTA